MKFTRLGASGLQVSRICLGMMTYGSPRWRAWVLDEAASRPIVRRAFELGINFFDTADMYSNGESERVTGRLLKEFGRREEVVLATKAFYPVFDDVTQDAGTGAPEQLPPNCWGLSRKHIFAAIDASLQRLGTDYVDLYQVHRWDYQTPIEETMEALHDVVKSGKARYIGASSMWAWQFAKAQQVARERGWSAFVSMQNHYNLIYREEEREMIPLCRDQGVGLIPWSPLARGFLAGNRSRVDRGEDKGGATARARSDALAERFYFGEADYRVLDALSAVAQARGLSNARVAYAWLLHKGVAAPIVGSSKPAQLEDACAAVDLSLSGAEIEALESEYRPRANVGHH